MIGQTISHYNILQEISTGGIEKREQARNLVIHIERHPPDWLWLL